MRRRLAAFSGCGDMRPEARPLGPDRRRTVTTFCRAFGVSSAAGSQRSAASAMLHLLCSQAGVQYCRTRLMGHGWHADRPGHPRRLWTPCYGPAVAFGSLK
jgi:hypothetical protein